MDLNKSKHRAFFLIVLLLSNIASAQNISVASFRLLENDLTANTTGTMERDQNGEPAALIKVVTTQQGFVFDVGSLGVVKTKQGTGEIWVYVPHGIKKMTVHHQQLGVLRDYPIPISIEKARTYEMVLTTGKVETVVTHSVNKQFVIIKVDPVDAIVELNDEMLTVDSEGYATKGVAYGTYNYRVSCANYHTEAGQVTVTAEGKAEENVTLRPNFGWIKFVGGADFNGADVYIDNERAGKLPFVSDKLKSGAHSVKIVKNMYKTYERQVVVQDNETTELNVEMIPNFAVVTLTADAESEIWIDGARRGKGRWNGRLEIGDYTVEVKKESHRTASQVLQINTTETQTLELKSPTPIYASLEVSSTPLLATVYIDGEEVGITPLIKNDVLVGTRRITFKKTGYNVANRTLLVLENEENKVSAELVKMQSVAPTSKPAAKPSQPTANKPQPTSKPNGTKKSAEWSGLLGLDVGYSNYGFDYGGELGIALNKFSLCVGVKSHIMGKYEYRHDMMNDFYKTRKVRLLRFSTKLGYTFGRKWQFTPQVGILFGPSYFTGRKYITREIKTYEEMKELSGYSLGNYFLLEGADYTAMNRNIMNFARKRLAIVLGARMGVTLSRNGRWSMYVNPEYIINEGVGLNAGLTMKF